MPLQRIMRLGTSVNRHLSAPPQVLLLMLMLTLCSSGLSQKLEFFLFTPPQNYMSKFFQEFSNDAAFLTSEALDIDIHLVGELPYKPNQAASITGRNLVQLAHTTGTFIEGEVSIAPLVELPGLVKNQKDLEAAMDAFIPHLNNELQPYGVEVLFWFGQPRKVVSGRGSTPENFRDLKGLRVRTLGGLDGDVVDALDMRPVTMPPGDVPLALQRGTIDGTLSSWLFVIDNKWAEQMSWTIDTSFGAITNFILINSNAFSRLSPETQQALRDLGSEYQKKMTKYSFEQVETYRSKLVEAGLDIVTISEQDLLQANNLFEAFTDKWARNNKDGAKDILQDVRRSIEKSREE